MWVHNILNINLYILNIFKKCSGHDILNINIYIYIVNNVKKENSTVKYTTLSTLYYFCL